MPQSNPQDDVPRVDIEKSGCQKTGVPSSFFETEIYFGYEVLRPAPRESSSTWRTPCIQRTRGQVSTESAGAFDALHRQSSRRGRCSAKHLSQSLSCSSSLSGRLRLLF